MCLLIQRIFIPDSVCSGNLMICRIGLQYCVKITNGLIRILIFKYNSINVNYIYVLIVGNNLALPMSGCGNVFHCGALGYIAIALILLL